MSKAEVQERCRALEQVLVQAVERLEEDEPECAEETESAADARPGIVWFRGDLRLHENEALSQAQAQCSSLLPVYCFDPCDYGKSPKGYDKTGPFRAQFLGEAVADLQSALRALDSDLIVRFGRPEEELGELVRRTGAGAVYCQTEVTTEELQVKAAVKAAVQAAGAELRTFWGATLAHREDLPFPLEQLPQKFEKFRERTAGMAPRAVLPAPTELRGLPSDVRVEAGEIPTLQQLGLEPVLSGKAAPADGPLQCGGEEEALRQLHRFLAQAAPNDGAGVAAGSAFGCNFASCIAPWLAISCLSPRRLLEEAQRVLGGAGQAGPAAAAAQTPLERVQFELLWRDFFRFMALKYSTDALSRAR